MLPGERCELCGSRVEGKRAQFKQTKYCARCAKLKKKENSLSSWHAEEKKAYMRAYMRAYRRRRPQLSTPYVRKHRELKRSAQADLCRNTPAAPLATVSREKAAEETSKSPHAPLEARAGFSFRVKDNLPDSEV